MRPHEEDEPQEHRAPPTGGPYREEQPGPRGQQGGGREPWRQSRYQSPPPRGPPPEGPPGGPQSGSPPTRLDQARQAQSTRPVDPQRAPPQAPGGQGQQAPPPAQEQPSGPAQRSPPAGAPGGQEPVAGTGGPPAGQPGVQGQQGQPGVQGQPMQGRPGDLAGLAPVGVGELLQTEVVTAELDTPVATVVAEMAEKGVGSVVVVEEDEPVGIVTDRGIALALETTPDVAEREVEELLAEEFVTGSTEMTAVDVLHRLSDTGVRRLPIVDEDGGLAGIVTLDDVLVLLSEELANAAEVIRTQSPRL